MKTAITALLLLLPFAAHAQFDSSRSFECKAEDGTRILVNDEFSGGNGRALVSGKKSPLYAVGVQNAKTGMLHFLISSGQRALANEFSLRMNVRAAERTTRQEGPILAEYLYVQAELEVTNLWSGNQVLSASCLQSLP